MVYPHVGQISNSNVDSQIILNKKRCKANYSLRAHSLSRERKTLKWYLRNLCLLLPFDRETKSKSTNLLVVVYFF